MALADMQIADYIKNKPYKCGCGRIHSADIDEILIGSGVINETGAVVDKIAAKYGFDKSVHSIFMLADGNTYKAVGEKTENILTERGYKINKLILPGETQVVPDEKTIFKALHAINREDRFIIAAGSGTINDMCRYLCFKLGVPYIIVASAPSMDGFAANVAPLVVNNKKTTYITTTPRAIIGDIDILKEAPLNLIAAGLGDILGKYNALCDWKNSNIITGENYCAELAGMVGEATKKCEQSADGLAKRDERSITMLMEALVLTGISISFWGFSRPASSAEHHVAHFWEMVFLYEGKEAVLHGAKVGVSSVAMAYLYNKLAETDIDFDGAYAAANDFDFDKWAAAIREQYRDSADMIIEKEMNVGFYKPENRKKRIDAIKNNLPEIIETINKYTPPEERITEMIKKAGGPVRPSDVGITRETVYNGLLYAKDTRDLYSILQILGDLGLLDRFAASFCDFIEQIREN